MRGCARARACVCMYVCMCVCMCVCVCVCVCVCERPRTRASDRTKHRRFDTARCDFTERRLVHAQLAHCAGATARPTPVGNTLYAAAGGYVESTFQRRFITSCNTIMWPTSREERCSRTVRPVQTSRKRSNFQLLNCESIVRSIPICIAKDDLRFRWKAVTRGKSGIIIRAMMRRKTVSFFLWFPPPPLWRKLRKSSPLW